MANESTTSNRFPANQLVFKDGHYDRWCAQMRDIFMFQDVLEIVNDGIPASEVNANDAQITTHRENGKKDGKRLFLIH